jgi:transcriptional regulator with XRE-family HTH domain
MDSERVRQHLARELKRLRLAAGLSTPVLAQRIGVHQTTISRIEAGKKRVSLQQVDAWCDAVDADRSTRRDLLKLAEEVLVGPRSWAAAGDGTTTDLQREIAKYEAAAGVISFYQPVSIPGLLQTPAYARQLLSSGPDGPPADLANRVINRMERQRILYDASKRLRFVVPEVALLWPYGPVEDPAVLDEHREQLTRVETAMARDNVTVGILPLRPLEYWRLSGFVIYDDIPDDDPFVHLELLHKPYDVTEPEAVGMFRRTFENLMQASLHGDEAAKLLARVREGIDR